MNLLITICNWFFYFFWLKIWRNLQPIYLLWSSFNYFLSAKEWTILSLSLILGPFQFLFDLDSKCHLQSAQNLTFKQLLWSWSEGAILIEIIKDATLDQSIKEKCLALYISYDFLSTYQNLVYKMLSLWNIELPYE